MAYNLLQKKCNFQKLAFLSEKSVQCRCLLNVWLALKSMLAIGADEICHCHSTGGSQQSLSMTIILSPMTSFHIGFPRGMRASGPIQIAHLKTKQNVMIMRRMPAEYITNLPLLALQKEMVTVCLCKTFNTQHV